MKYSQRWALACALKQPYPIPGETGAEEATAAPPVFQVAGGWGTTEKTVAIGAGVLGGALLTALFMRGRRGR